MNRARFRFDGKVALVTGATSGIGRETALALARAGATIAAVGRRAPLGDELVRTIEDLGGKAVFLRADVTDEDQIAHAVAAAVDAFGRLDLAFNNAGSMGRGPADVQDTGPADWSAVVETGFRGCWHSLKHEIPVLRRLGGGAIVNCSSVTGLIGFPRLSLYTATKHAIVGLTKAVALENAAAGIRVNAVCPSAVDTALLRVLPDDVVDGAIAVHPISRLGTLAEVVDLVSFLLSDSAGFITGQSYAMDGGYSAG